MRTSLCLILIATACGGGTSRATTPTTATTADVAKDKQRAFQLMWETLDAKGARAAFEAVLAARPDDTDAQAWLPLLYCDEERWADALAVAERFAAGGTPDALAVLAEVQLMGSDLAGAEATYGRLVERDPGSVTGWEGRASVRFHRGDWDGGLALLRAATPADAAGRNELRQMEGWALVVSGRAAEGVAVLASIPADIDPTLPMAAALEAGDDAQVIALTANAGDTDADRWPLAFRVIAQSRAGQLEAAAATLARLEAIPFDPAQPWLANERRIARAHLELARGATSEAVALFLHPRILNHNSLYDPRRAQAHGGEDHFALAGKLYAATAYAKAGKREEARGLLAPLTRSYRAGIGAVAIRLRAVALLAELG
jgi:tetratricopeptide (TPR) repeat protein